MPSTTDPPPTDFGLVPRAEDGLTPELARRLLDGIRAGYFKEDVALANAVRAEDLDLWIQMGLSPGAVEPYRTFARVFVAQETGQQQPYVEAWRQAAATDWQAARAWLAARYPDRWGPKATKTKQAADLQPTAADAAAEEAMVAQLIAARPPVLVRLLKEAGVEWPEPKSPGDRRKP